MRFKIPGRTTNVRLFERVETNDPQHHIFDVGIEYEDGSIDWLVIPGSGSYTLITRVFKSRNRSRPKAWLYRDARCNFLFPTGAIHHRSSDGYSRG